MPSLLLLKQAPLQFVRHQALRRLPVRQSVEAFIVREADDFAQLGDVWLFVRVWRLPRFNPLAFARAHTFLHRLARRLRREGYRAEPLAPCRPPSSCPAWLWKPI